MTPISFDKSVKVPEAGSPIDIASESQIFKLSSVWLTSSALTAQMLIIKSINAVIRNIFLFKSFPPKYLIIDIYVFNLF